MRHCALLLAVATSVFTAPADAAEMPTIALSSPQAGSWAVRYTLAAPAKALRFERVDAKGNRAKTWVPADPAFELVLDGKEEVVRRRDGAEFSETGFSMQAMYMPLENDYAPFSPFGDGGLLIHTGRFHACAVRCEESAEPSWQFTVTPPAGTHVVQGGTVRDGAATFASAGEGSNIYVGAATPVETPHVIAIVDEKFPARTREQLQEDLPRILDLFARHLGALDAKPMLFASNDENRPGGGYGVQGGVLPGQVFMHLYGRAPADSRGAALADQMTWYFAHEAAHVYQRYADHDSGGGSQDSWIHEGGAEAFAGLALRELDPADVQLDARLRKGAEACGVALEKGPMRDFESLGHFKDNYTCGIVLQMLVDVAARAKSDGRCDLYCVWTRYLEVVRGGKPWSTRTYLEVVGELADRKLAELIDRLHSQRTENPRQLLDAALRDVGLVSAAATP